MKGLFLTVLPVAASAAAISAPTQPVRFIPGLSRLVSARPNPALLYGPPPYMPLKDGKTIPAVTTLKPKLVEGAIRKKIRYGPYHLPASGEFDPQWMAIPGANGEAPGKKEKGDSSIMRIVEPPCKDCSVLYADLSVENEDGSHSGVSDGSYLHHAVMVAAGFGRTSGLDSGLGCNYTEPATPLPGNFGTSVFAVGTSDDGESWFTDRSGKFNSGFHLRATDSLSIVTDIMNYKPYNRTVYLALETEYLPKIPKNNKDVEWVVLSVQNCGAAIDFDLPDAKFAKDSPNWVVPADGTIVNMAGHLHDGGDSLRVRINGKEVCNSHAEYGTKPDWVMHSADGKPWEALSHMEECSNLDRIRKGDLMSITASYDLGKHRMRMDTNGEKETVMGLALMHVAFD